MPRPFSLQCCGVDMHLLTWNAHSNLSACNVVELICTCLRGMHTQTFQFAGPARHAAEISTLVTKTYTNLMYRESIFKIQEMNVQF